MACGMYVGTCRSRRSLWLSTCGIFTAGVPALEYYHYLRQIVLRATSRKANDLPAFPQMFPFSAANVWKDWL